MCLSCQIKDENVLKSLFQNAQPVDLKAIYEQVEKNSKETIDRVAYSEEEIVNI
jgi:hypothetical protein